MTTSLAAQLKKLSVPDAQASLSPDYKQTSFLYDEKEAAKYDRQHFYNIGVNGLHQLVAKDERFAEFERNLFSQNSQSVQRLMQTSEVNKELDDTINKFLLMLSPYMQLREAHKALEWLVNRYNVHLRNVDSLMMCLLPFYDQEPFIMGLRILDLNSSNCRPWKWLEPVKKANTYLPQKTLLTHCRSANGFMGLLCNMLAKHIEASRDINGNPSVKHLVRVISFFTQTVLGVILDGTLPEQTLSVLIPTLSKGFKATDLRDYVVSSYMIFSQLLSICTFKKSLLSSMLNVICKNVVPELLPSAIGVIVLMFQKQEISKIPEKALKYLMLHQSLTSILSSLCEKVKVEPFLTPLLTALTSSALIKHNESESDSASEKENGSSVTPFSFLMNILSSVALEKKTVAAVVRTLIDWLQVRSESDEDMDVDGDLGSEDDKPFEVFRLLERRYSSILSSTISKLLESDDESGKVKSVIEKLQLRSVNMAQQDMKLDPEAFIAVCLNHHEGSVRKNAIQQLLQDTAEIQDKQSLQHAIVLRLQDDDHEVVDAVLHDPKGLWDLFEDKQLLYHTMIKKLDALEKSKGKSSDLKMKVLQALCCMPKSEAIDAVETTVLLVSYLVPLSQKDTKFPQNLESGCAAFSKLIQHLSKGWLDQVKTLQKKMKGEELFSMVVVKLVEQISAVLVKQDPLQEMKSMYECVSKTPRGGCALLVLALVNASLIAKTTSQELKTALQKLLVTSISNFAISEGLFSFEKQEEHSCSSIEQVLCSCLSELKKSSHLDIDLIAFCVENIGMDGVPGSLKGKTFWQLSSEVSTESNWLWTEITMFNFLLELSSHRNHFVSQLAQKMFSQFLKKLGDVGSLTKILCGLWISQVDEKHLTVAHQARSLQFAEVYFKSLSDSEKKKIVSNENNPVLPCLLVLLSGKSERARHVSFNLMAALVDGVNDDTIIFKWFGENLLKYRQEVENDVAFLSQVLRNILEDSDSDPPPTKKARKSFGSSKPPMSSTGLHHLMDILTNLATPYVIRLGILHSFGRLDSLESFVPLMKFLGVLLEKSSFATAFDEKAALRHSIKLILQHITPNTATCMTVGSDSLKVLQRALNCTDMVLARGDNVQMLTAAQLSRKVMSALPPESCQVIFSQLLDVMSVSANTDIFRSCRKVIKNMKLHSKLIITETTNVLGKDLAATVRETKRQKMSSKTTNPDQETDALESKSWKRVTTLLEIIQNKKMIIDAIPLVPAAFQVLGRVLELEMHSSGEYIKQLLLGVIYKICSADNSDGESVETEQNVKGEHLRIELIVQCIRNSDNPHTHHQALLLLSEAAKIAPNLLLHNMMSVFIFMGTSILRQDDEYSFHVIERILENVIPAIRLACEEKSRGSKNVGKKKKSMETTKGQSEDMMTVVLRVFVDAIPHIPSHRKIMLFQKLLTVLGVDDYLWRLVLLFIENVVQRPKTESAEEEKEQTSGPLSAVDLEFLSSLFEAFSTPQCFQCVRVATDFLMHLPDETGQEDHPMKQAKKDVTKIEDLSKNDTEIFSVEHHSAKQLRHFKYGSVFALSHLMGSQHLVAELSQQDPESFLSQYQSTMETVLQFISQVTKSHDLHQQTASGRFWKFLLHKCHDLLDNMVNLLPDAMFMTVVCGLMEHSLPMVQKRAMELLNTKLHYYKESGVHSQQKAMLWPIVTKLQVIVKQTLLPKKSKASKFKEEDVTNGQTAIYGLKVLCRILGEADHEPFLEVLDLCVKALSCHEDNGTVCASAMLCVAEVMSAAKTHAIEYLKELMPLVIAQLQTPSSEHGVLLVAAITSLQKIIEAVPLFLSPYLSDIVVQICTVHSEVEADSQKPIVMQKIKQICTTLATVTSTRTFLPIMEKSFKALEDKLSDCAECLLSMLKEHIENMTRENLALFLQDLVKFFFVFFGIRADKPDMLSTDVATIEGFVIDAFVALVFKLSEAQFKPMLMQLYSWATDEDASKERILTFYRVCSSLAENLKNLFTLFAGHILKLSADVLDANNNSKSKAKYFGKGKEARKKSCQLLEYVLSCLQKTFHHDTECFMNKERFDVVMQSIVDQLENMLGKPHVVSHRVEKYVVPCITSLAHSSKDDLMWKLINYQVLLKTRNEQEQVRIWALSAVDALHKKLGEDYTHLVAETIPFIAELMEDESDEVEKYTHKVVAAMEVSVGENLQEYF